jgi:hypothetical protein
MQTHEIRVADEQSDLAKKVERLEGFIGTPTYHALSHAHQFLLRKQLLTMREYLDILNARMALFATPGASSG